MIEDLVIQGVLPHCEKIILETQPDNSPVLNMLHLGLFNALQDAYYTLAPRDPLDLIHCVEKMYDQ
jgi:hypothetical protein